MQPPVEPRDAEDFEPILTSEDQQMDFAALRILAAWISLRAGIDPELGATIDRGFVVAQAHA